MAKWLSARSERRWNHAASIVEAANAGNRFVPGLYRAPIRAVACPDLDLAPGSYPAVAGATIAGGASGAAVYGGRVIIAVNQSECPVKIGDLVGLHVSPACEAFFVPCVCNCSSGGPSDCCDKFVAVCVNGITQIVNLADCDASSPNPWGAGPYYTFKVGTCCPDFTVDVCSNPPVPANPDFFFITLKLCCSGNSVFLYYTTSCTGLPGFEPTIVDVSEICDPSPGIVTREITATAVSTSETCVFDVVIAPSASSDLCAPCGEPPPPPPCCDKLLWFCVNNESVQLAVDGGTHTWDVSACCACTTASLEINLSCNPTTDVITLSWEFICDGGPPETGAENTLMSLFCESNDQRIITLVGASCFLQISATIIETACAACEPTPTTPPPP